MATLNRAKETLSDSLLVAMVIKGLIDEYNPFSVHVIQTREVLTFMEFKQAESKDSDTEIEMDPNGNLRQTTDTDS